MLPAALLRFPEQTAGLETEQRPQCPKGGIFLIPLFPTPAALVQRRPPGPVLTPEAGREAKREHEREGGAAAGRENGTRRRLGFGGWLGGVCSPGARSARWKRPASPVIRAGWDVGGGRAAGEPSMKSVTASLWLATAQLRRGDTTCSAGGSRSWGPCSRWGCCAWLRDPRFKAPLLAHRFVFCFKLSSPPVPVQTHVP